MALDFAWDHDGPVLFSVEHGELHALEDVLRAFERRTGVDLDPYGDGRLARASRTLLHAMLTEHGGDTALSEGLSRTLDRDEDLHWIGD